MNTPQQGGKQTVVEEGTDLQGTIRSKCHVVVNGSIDGQIEAPSLTITETGTVLGTVKAEKLHSEGTLAGDIDAGDVYLSGSVRSNTMIRAKKLEVKLSPDRGKLEVTFGECLMEVGEDPAVQQEPVIEESVQAEAPEKQAALVASPDPSRNEEEPTWSEPPPATLAAGSDAVSVQVAEDEISSDAETSDPEVAVAKENGARRAKRNHQRDSQAPPPA